VSKFKLRTLKIYLYSFILGRFFNYINSVFVNGNWGKMQKETTFVFGKTVHNFQ